MGRKKMFVSSAKAERELGWKTVPVDEALRRAVEWFRATGMRSSYADGREERASLPSRPSAARSGA